MAYFKWAVLALRIQGLLALLGFCEDAVTAVEMIAGIYFSRKLSLQGIITLGAMKLLVGIYLVFFPRKVIRLIMFDAALEESDETTRAIDFKRMTGVGIKIFGTYLFYQGLHNGVTAFNVATGNWTPESTEASAYVLQAAFHLGLGLIFIFQTRNILGILFRGEEV